MNKNDFNTPEELESYLAGLEQISPKGYYQFIKIEPFVLIVRSYIKSDQKFYDVDLTQTRACVRAGVDIDVEAIIEVENDPRFSICKEIQYEREDWKTYGRSMPLETLWQLIKYLHRLEKLEAFD